MTKEPLASTAGMHVNNLPAEQVIVRAVDRVCPEAIVPGAEVELEMPAPGILVVPIDPAVAPEHRHDRVVAPEHRPDPRAEARSEVAAEIASAIAAFHPAADLDQAAVLSAVAVAVRRALPAAAADIAWAVADLAAVAVEEAAAVVEEAAAEEEDVGVNKRT